MISFGHLELKFLSSFHFKQSLCSVGNFFNPNLLEFDDLFC